MFLIVVVVCLSCVRHNAKVHVGARIFTINMMLVDALHAFVSFLTDFQSADKDFKQLLYDSGCK